jgi:hypothetical protein
MFHFKPWGRCTHQYMYLLAPEAVDMNGRFQMQGGKNWFLPKEMNANRFFCDSHWLEIWSNHFYPSMGPNGGSVAMDSGEKIQFTIPGCQQLPQYSVFFSLEHDCEEINKMPLCQEARIREAGPGWAYGESKALQRNFFPPPPTSVMPTSGKIFQPVRKNNLRFSHTEPKLHK